jgi:hypothetical protein
MKIITGRLAAAATMIAAPVLIALGTAGMSHADAGLGSTPNAGSSISHPAFPHQHNFPQPGTAVHHHHQNHK